MKKIPIILTGIICIGLLPGWRYQKQQQVPLKGLQKKLQKIQENKLINHEYASDEERIEAVNTFYLKKRCPLATAYNDIKKANRQLRHILRPIIRIEQRACKKQNNELILQARTLQNEAKKLQNNAQKIIQAIQNDPEYEKQCSLQRIKNLKRVGYNSVMACGILALIVPAVDALFLTAMGLGFVSIC